MAFYRTCNGYGAHLDPGERCDCQRDRPVMRVPGKVPMAAKKLVIKTKEENQHVVHHPN